MMTSGIGFNFDSAWPILNSSGIGASPECEFHLQVVKYKA